MAARYVSKNENILGRINLLLFNVGIKLLKFEILKSEIL
jgi:hypothetical protein